MALTRHLLRSDLLQDLKRNIADGLWNDSLPSERQLTDYYQVSRGTLRHALKSLQDQKVIKSVPGSGYILLRKVRRPSTTRKDVSIGLLIGRSDKNRTNRDRVWIPELQQRLSKREWNLHIHEGIPEVERSPKSGIAKLFNATNHDCWLLHTCKHAIQSEFQDAKGPSIICGSPFEGINLPSIDMDFRALGRHAAGAIIAKGHNHIGFISGKEPFPGDAKLLEGFREGISGSSRNVTFKVTRYSSSRHSYTSFFNRITTGRDSTTALFVDCPYQLLNLHNQAAKAGIGIPGDLSIVCRQGTDFLNYISPDTSRYEFNTKEMARKVHQEIESAVRGDSIRDHRVLVLPEFHEGKPLKSIGTNL
ncbi:MAG: substrate-binding domain-containing protein [Opitutales bacterium]|nr:substrate-binding domain-containing protein [Opitutales bacterium]